MSRKSVLCPAGTWAAVKMPWLQYCTVRFQRSMNSVASLVETELGKVVARSCVISAERDRPPPSLELWASVKNAVIHCWSVADWFVSSQLASPPNSKFSAVVTASSLAVHLLQECDVTGDPKARALARCRCQDARQVRFHLIERRDRGNHLGGLRGCIAVVPALAVDQSQIAERRRNERQGGHIAVRASGVGGLIRARDRRSGVDRRIACRPRKLPAPC